MELNLENYLAFGVPPAAVNSAVVIGAPRRLSKLEVIAGVF
jgi:hypothetical protein